MRTALIALALVACSTPAPAPVDGGAGDGGYVSDAADSDAYAIDCSRCVPVVCHPALGTGCSCDDVTLERRCHIACDDGTVPACPVVTETYCPNLEAPHCE